MSATKPRKIGNKPDRNGFEDHGQLVLPFIQISGRWHVVVNWQPGMKTGQNLELRPLSQLESDWLESELEDAVFEVWARLFPTDEAIKTGAEPSDDGEE